MPHIHWSKFYHGANPILNSRMIRPFTSRRTDSWHLLTKDNGQGNSWLSFWEAIAARHTNYCWLALLLWMPMGVSAAVIPKPPPIAASAFLLMDFDTNAILMEHNIDQRLEPASLTKILTAYVAFSELKQGRMKLSDTTLVSKKAWRTGGSRMFIEVNKRVSIEDLLHGIIVQSGNDASVAIAEHIAGDEVSFAHMMNLHAQRLGANDSHFVNASGLPDKEHYTTTRDMAIIAQSIIRDFQKYYPMHAERSFTYNNISQPNRNALLGKMPGVDGLKTGYTRAAGYCLVVSAKRDNMRLLTLVMNAKTSRARTRQARSMLQYGFRFYETQQHFSVDQPVTTAHLWKGQQEELALGLLQPLVLTLQRGQHQYIDTQIETHDPIKAPVDRGDVFGKLRLSLNGQMLAEHDLVAINGVAKGSFWRRLHDHVMLWFE